MTPSVSSLANCGLAPYQYVCQHPHNLHSGSSLIPQLCIFVGVGRVLYTDQSRKEMQKVSVLQSSGHMILCFGGSHFVLTLCSPSSTFLDLHPSSSRHWTSAWSRSLLCLALLSPIAGSGWFWTLVSPHMGSRWHPSTSLNFLPVPLMCQLPTCILILCWHLNL